MRTQRRLLLLVIVGVAACSDDSTSTPSVPPCEPGVRDVAVPEDAPYRLLVANGYVYWTSARLDGPKRVRRASIEAGVVETVGETTRELGSLAVDGDGAIYWVEATAGTNAGAIMVARPGNQPTPLYSVAGGLDAFGVAIDDTDVYWVVHGRGSSFTQTVFHGPKTGGTAAALGSVSMPSSDQSIGSMTTGGGFVYWSNGANLISRLPREGGTPVTVLDDPDGVAAFVVDDGIAFAIVRDASSSIVRVDATTTPPTRTTVTSGHAARWSLALDGERLFAATSDDRVISLPTSGGEPSVEVSENVRTAGGLAIAGDRLYWANTATAEAGGAVRWICRM